MEGKGEKQVDPGEALQKDTRLDLKFEFHIGFSKAAEDGKRKDVG